MTATYLQHYADYAPAIEQSDPYYVPEVVDALLQAAQAANASDIHLLPGEDGLLMLWRVDGVLQQVTQFPREISANIIARLKVLAELLTYKTDVPQEGRIRQGESDVEIRVSTFPTLFGEKGVVRLFVGSGQYRYLDDLELPEHYTTELKQLLLERGGLILVTGPAGSGKTTTLYACLRALVEQSSGMRNIVTLEDPVEAVVAGVAQSQIKSHAGFDFKTGLRSLMRQDPEVILVGEIRDRETARIVFEASLTGHLVLSSFHSGSAAEAVARLLEMGVEPYQLRSGLLCAVNQRLARRLCDCAIGVPSDNSLSCSRLSAVKQAGSCEQCAGTGYQGRLIIAEMLQLDKQPIAEAILSRSDSCVLEQAAVQEGMITRWQHARELLAMGLTTPEEIVRVLGMRQAD